MSVSSLICVCGGFVSEFFACLHGLVWWLCVWCVQLVCVVCVIIILCVCLYWGVGFKLGIGV